MEPIGLKILFLLALSFTGLLCGASLDQSIKQLPARRKIGNKAFSEYAKAADLSNGVPWYAILGIGGALTSVITAILVWVYCPQKPYSISLYLGGICAICHSICTSQAAPTYHRQKVIHGEEELGKLFNRFEFIQTIRSIFILLNFLCFIWALTFII